MTDVPREGGISGRCRSSNVARVVAAATLVLIAVAGGRARPRTHFAASAAPRAQVAASPVSAAPGAAPTSDVAPASDAITGTTLHLLVGRTLIITSPAKIKRVSLADPTVAEAEVVNPYQVVLDGKAPGGVSLVIWDEFDRSRQFDVSVDVDIASLRAALKEAFPSEPVQLEAAKDALIVSGEVSSPEVEDEILQVVKSYADKVISVMRVATPEAQEILLEVKFAEVDRTALQQLGINILSLPGAKNVGSISTQEFSPALIQGQVGTLSGGGGGSSAGGSNGSLSLSDLLNIFIYRQDINLAATIQALQSNNLLQILAEPNLLTESGKDASFLAGGQFPFPVVQSSGTGAFPAITIQFKEFGVRLDFTPTLMPNGLIHLKVAPEVSALDFSNALTIQGFQIPALSTRRVESEMELRDGQTFAIAGLMDNRVTEQFSKIPGIGDIPVLGKLFESRSQQKSDDELLIVVTPRIVHPPAAENPPPGPVFPRAFLPPAKPSGAPEPNAQPAH